MMGCGHGSRCIHHSLRAAWQPAFARGSLDGFEPLIHASTVKLIAKLQHSAHAAAEVEIWAMFGKMTMDVVGSAAFGCASPQLCCAPKQDLLLSPLKQGCIAGLKPAF